MVLVTRQAPDFTAAAVLGNGEIVENFNLKKHLNGKPAVLFFWPMDFTFVCPSELIAFDHRYEEFQKRGVEVVGVSFDSEFVHNAWRKTPVDKGPAWFFPDRQERRCSFPDRERPANRP